MVDVGDKPVTLRYAKASGRVRMQPATLRMIRAKTAAKGDVLEVARLAGILAVQPDVAVVDLTLKLGDGLSLIKQLHRRCPALRILVFSMHQEAHFATAAFAAGGHGYVVKDEGTEGVLEAIQILTNGGSYLSEQMAAKAPDLVPRARTRSSTRAG